MPAGGFASASRSSGSFDRALVEVWVTAFVRWRGTCAQLLATVYENGRSRQILLTNLPNAYVLQAQRKAVSTRFPDIHVDWAAVDEAIARGWPGPRPVPRAIITCAAAEHLLRSLAEALCPDGRMDRDATRLLDAAHVLTTVRVNEGLAKLLPDTDASVI